MSEAAINSEVPNEDEVPAVEGTEVPPVTVAAQEEWTVDPDALRETFGQAVEVGRGAYSAEGDMAEICYLTRTQVKRTVNGAMDLGGTSSQYRFWSSDVFYSIIPELSEVDAVEDLKGRVYAYSFKSGRCVEVGNVAEGQPSEVWIARSDEYRKAVLAALSSKVAKVTEEDGLRVDDFEALPASMSNALVMAKRTEVDRERERYRERINKRVMRLVRDRHTPEEIIAAGLQVRRDLGAGSSYVEASGTVTAGIGDAGSDAGSGDAGSGDAGTGDAGTGGTEASNRQPQVVDADEDAFVTAFNALDPFAEVLVLRRCADGLLAKVRESQKTGLPAGPKIAAEVAAIVAELVKIQSILTA